MRRAMQHSWDEVDDYHVDDDPCIMDDLVAQLNIEPLPEYVDSDNETEEVKLASSKLPAKYPTLVYFPVPHPTRYLLTTHVRRQILQKAALTMVHYLFPSISGFIYRSAT